MNRARTALTALTLTLAMSLTGCGSDSSPAPAKTTPKAASSPSATSPSKASTPQAAPAVITIKDFKFTTPSTVKPGAAVMIKNEDGEAHTVTADGKGGFDVKIDPGATATLTAPSTAGSFPFHCTYHSDMHGTLTVS